MKRSMTKRAFLALLDRQRKSGLSMKEFSINEAYSPSNFYYWKSKFCSSHSQDFSGSGSQDISEDFAPVRFPVPGPLTSSSSDDMPKGINEIMIEFPVGVKIHFRGSNEWNVALGIISQICNSHVLPQ